MSLITALRTNLLPILLATAPVMVAHAEEEPANQSVDPADAIVDRWVQACNADEFTKARIKRMTHQEAATALNVLIGGGEIDALGELSVDEACLTLAGTEKTGRPTFTLKRSIDPNIGIAEAMIRTLPRQAQTMTLAHRLDELQLDLHGPFAEASERFQEWQQADPELAKGILNQGVAQMAAPESRAFAIQSPGSTSCLVVLEPKPLLQNFLGIAPASLVKGLSKNDRQWLADYGDAMEFWHEVAHCQHPDTYDAGEVVEGPLSSEGSGSCTAIAENKSLVEQLVSQQSAFENTLANDSGASQISPAGQSPVTPSVPPAQAQDAFELITDYRQLAQLSEEALMDRFGRQEVAQRFGLPDSGCTTSTLPSHPWDKFRVLWSIGEPDTRYLSWLQPWLVDQPFEVQRHLLADAWGGVLKTKKAVSGKFIYRDWMLNRVSQKRQGNAFYSPALEADPKRAVEWADWLGEILQAPGALQDAIRS